MGISTLDGRYRLLEVLGSGGMAKVYLAFDEVLEREVAVKLLREQFAEDGEFVERFRREAKSAAALHHRNIVEVYDQGRLPDGSHFMAMEYVRGGTLKDRIERGPLDAGEAAGISLAVAEALGAAHRRGIVHRDIKPQNILMSGRGEPKVADFGIAHAASAATLTRKSLVLGTVGYMSPEQALGDPVGPPSDLYSLGVVLYEMLAGALPHNADTPVAVAIKHVNETPRRPREVSANIPPDLEELTMRLLAKRPEDRFADGGVLAAELRRTLDGTSNRPTVATSAVRRASTGVPAESFVRRPLVSEAAVRARRRRRTGRLLAACLAGILLIGGGTLAAGKLDLAREAQRSAPVVADAAAGRPEVPNVVGMTLQQAKSRLSNAGFEVKSKDQTSSADEIGKVLSQSVSGGTRAKRGAGVLLAVGSGPQRVATPNLTYLSGATATLEKAGLKLGRVKKLPSESVNKGAIISQDPAAGEEVKTGSAVGVVVSTGPSPKDTTRQTAPATLQQSAPPQTVPPQTVPQQSAAPQQSVSQQQTVIQQSPAQQSAAPPQSGTSSQEVTSQTQAPAAQTPAGQTTTVVTPGSGAPSSGATSVGGVSQNPSTGAPPPPPPSSGSQVGQTPDAGQLVEQALHNAGLR